MQKKALKNNRRIILCMDAFGRNPGPFESTVFPKGIPSGQDRRIRPLCHLSGAKVSAADKTAKTK